MGQCHVRMHFDGRYLIFELSAYFHLKTVKLDIIYICSNNDYFKAGESYGTQLSVRSIIMNSM